MMAIKNKATAALYYYTPYVPNSAALGAGWGLGNSCSAYGNRNFYLYFTTWFGSTHYIVTGAIKTYWTAHRSSSVSRPRRVARTEVDWVVTACLQDCTKQYSRR